MSFETISPKDIVKYIGRQDTILIDLRDYEEYRAGHIPTAVWIPYEELKTQIYRLSGYNIVILYCDRGNMSLLAARELKGFPFHIKNICGGIHAYRGSIER